MRGLEKYGGKIIERYEEGRDLFGFHYIKFAITTTKSKKNHHWTLYINPNKFEGSILW